jgi:transposase InsO family protein
LELQTGESSRDALADRSLKKLPRSDNGPEFMSKTILSFIVAQGISTALIESGKPWQNAVTESFNGKVRDECLSLEWFRSCAEAKVIIEAWRCHYNEVRPHSTLGYLTPNEFAARAAPSNATGPGRCGKWGPLAQPVAERPSGTTTAREPVSRLVRRIRQVMTTL